jgi:drug/metabolite transporter (DMT)-like permease
MLGALLSLLSAATFGLNAASLRRGVVTGSVLQAMAITVPAGVPLFALGCLAFGAFDALLGMSAEALGWFAAAGVVHFIVGRYGNYRATRVLGAAQSGPIQQVALLVSLALAIVFLGERLTTLRIIGILLILAGPLVIVRGAARKGEVRTRAGQKLNYVEGYFWGLVGALGFGSSPLLIKFGLEGGGGVQAGIAGGLVAYAAATVVIVLVILLPANIAHMRSLDIRNAVWFAAAGILVFVSQMLVYMALALAPVSVVAAIQRTAVVFRAIFSWLLNREHEVLGASVIAGIALSAIGLVAVTIDVDLLLDLVPLPAAIADTLRLTWP